MTSGVRMQELFPAKRVAGSVLAVTQYQGHGCAGMVCLLNTSASSLGTFLGNKRTLGDGPLSSKLFHHGAATSVHSDIVTTRLECIIAV